MREKTNTVQSKSTRLGLNVYKAKTKRLYVNSDNTYPITLIGEPLEGVDEFTYLGSTITSDLSLDEEINKKIGKAAATLSRLTQRTTRC